MTQQQNPSYGGPWFALATALGLHVFDEATTGFLNVYNPTVLAMRSRYAWFPMPTYTFGEWLTGLIAAVVILMALTPLAMHGVRWLRPLAWLQVVIQILNATGHTLGTIFGRTVATVTFPRPAPGFYSSPFLLAAAIWMTLRLRSTREP